MNKDSSLALKELTVCLRREKAQTKEALINNEPNITRDNTGY